MSHIIFSVLETEEEFDEYAQIIPRLEEKVLKKNKIYKVISIVHNFDYTEEVLIGLEEDK